MSAEHPRLPEIMLELLHAENPQVRAIAEEVATLRLNKLWFLRRAAPLCPCMRKYVTGKLISGNGVQRLLAAKILLDSGDVSSIRVLEPAVEMEGGRGGLDSAVCMGAALDVLREMARGPTKRIKRPGKRGGASAPNARPGRIRA